MVKYFTPVTPVNNLDPKIGEEGGCAGPLSATLKVPLSQIPASAITDVFVVADQDAMLALAAAIGDVAKRTDLGRSFILQALPASTLGNWIAIVDDIVTSVDGDTGDIDLSSVYEPVISPKGSAFNKAFGAGAGDVCEGNDGRLSDARTPTSHAHGNVTNDGKVGSTANLPIKTGTAGVVEAGAFGTGATDFCVGNDSRLSDARTPTSHSHGNVTNDGKIGSTANLPLKTGTAGAVEAGAFGTGATDFCVGNDSRLSDARTPTSHAHGSVTNDGKIGTTADLPIKTTTNGALAAGAFGTGATDFCSGNDARLSDARTPTAHSHTHASTTGQTANDHHNQSHAFAGGDHSASLKATVDGSISDADLFSTLGSEISALTPKTTMVTADMVLIEDSAATNAKKKATVGDLLKKCFGDFYPGTDQSFKCGLTTNLWSEVNSKAVNVYNTSVDFSTITRDSISLNILGGSKSIRLGWSTWYFELAQTIINVYKDMGFNGQTLSNTGGTLKGWHTIQANDNAGIAQVVNFVQPIIAGGAADLAIGYNFQLDSVQEAGLLAETDGAGSYREPVWKIPYYSGDYGVAWATAPAPAPAGISTGGCMFAAHNTNGAGSDRLYVRVNGVWKSAALT